MIVGVRGFFGKDVGREHVLLFFHESNRTLSKREPKILHQAYWTEEVDPRIGLENIILHRKDQTDKILTRLQLASGKVKEQGKVKPLGRLSC